MAKIEHAIIAEGIAMVRLEAGVLQKAAIGLYEPLGYDHIQPFGSCLDDPLSRLWKSILCHRHRPDC